MEFRIPRDRYGNFHPQILAILREQEEKCDRLAGALYTKGLTQEQVGDVDTVSDTLFETVSAVEMFHQLSVGESGVRLQDH